jgi:hypothetical protein
VRSTGVIASLAVVLLPAAAGAAPVPVSPRTIQANPVTLAFDAAGDGLASWRGLRGPDADTTTPFHALASRTPAGAWQAPRSLPRTVFSHDVALFGGGRLALVTEREQPAGHAHTRSLVTVSLGNVLPLAFGATRVVDRGPRRHVAFDGPQPTLFSPLVAATPSGTVVVAWQRSLPHRRSGVWAKVLGGRPRRLGPFGRSPSLALAADGSGLLTWRRGSRILGRVRSAAGAWGAIEVVARVGRFSEPSPASIAGSGGHFAVGLTEISRSGGGVRWRSSVHTRANGWHATTLEDATFVPTGRTSFVTDQLRTLVAVTPDGRMHAAWPALRDGSVHAATADIENGQATSPALFGDDVAVDDLAAGADGHWAVTWFDLSRPEGTPNLVERGAGDPQATMGLATERAVVGSRFAYDPLTGRPTVIWSQGTAPAGFQIVAG